MDILRLAKLAPLVGKDLSDLTLPDLELAAAVFDIEVVATEELRNAALALLQGKNIHSVADLIQSPESVQQLISMFRRSKDTTAANEYLVRCKHCKEFFLTTV